MATQHRSTGICACCGELKRLVGRRLCHGCYMTSRRNGTLADFERRRRTEADTTEEVRFLADAGAGHDEIAVRLGITTSTVRVALWRSRTGATQSPRSHGNCVCCGKPGTIRGRGLIAACYQAARVNGTLADFERRVRPLVDTVEDYLFMRASGEIKPAIAQRLGITCKSLNEALRHARKRGLLPVTTSPISEGSNR